MTEPLRLSFVVQCSREHAFRVWTTKLSQWWPASHTVTGSSDVDVVLEPWVGGRIFERGADGVEHDWGQISRWDPPDRFGYRWHLRQDRADATQVEILFVDEGGGTRVEIEHSGWERLGAKGPGLRERNQAGWQGLLPHLMAACEDSVHR
jgi:uncharacterized protein YndB with AHSA1/START domain